MHTAMVGEILLGLCQIKENGSYADIEGLLEDLSQEQRRHVMRYAGDVSKLGP